MGNLWGIEKSYKCRSELSLSDCGPRCMYKNMLDFLPPDDKNDFHLRVSSMAYDTMVELASKGKFTQRSAQCMNCKKRCETQVASVHVAGPPCIDFSPQGSRKGYTGNTFPTTLLWMSQRMMLLEEIILLASTIVVPQHRP